VKKKIETHQVVIDGHTDIQTHEVKKCLLQFVVVNVPKICGNKMPTRCNRRYLLQILLFAQHISGTIMPIIRSSRVLYIWSLPVVFGAVKMEKVICRLGIICVFGKQ